MLTCKEVSTLVSESLDHPLPFRQRMGVQFHLMMCSLCRTYRRQVLTLRGMARHADDFPAEHLSREARQRIKNTLKSEEK